MPGVQSPILAAFCRQPALLISRVVALGVYAEDVAPERRTTGLEVVGRGTTPGRVVPGMRARFVPAIETDTRFTGLTNGPSGLTNGPSNGKTCRLEVLMSRSKRDDQKTKKELILELEKLRSKLSADEPGIQGATSREPTLSGDISRRDALKIAWVTPVILSVPLGSIGGVRRAQAQVTLQPTIMAPTTAPTSAPTTAAPTTMPPTPSSSLAPTAFPSARAVPALSAGGAAAVAAGLFGIGVKRLRGASKSGKDAGASDNSASDDGSEDDDGSGEA